MNNAVGFFMIQGLRLGGLGLGVLVGQVMAQHTIVPSGAANCAFGSGGALICQGVPSVQGSQPSVGGVVKKLEFGVNARATGSQAIAFGDSTSASGKQSIAFGVGNAVSGDYSGAFGDPSYMGADFSYTFGNDNLAGRGSSNVNALGNNNSFGATGYYYYDGDNYKLINDVSSLQGITGNLNPSVDIKKTEVDNARVIGNDNYVSSSNTHILGSHVGVKSDVSPKSIGRRRIFTYNDKGVAVGYVEREIYTVEDRVIGTQADSVYLGDYSTAVEGNQQQPNQNVANITSTGANGATTTAGTKGTVSSATIDGTTYGNFAGAQSVGGVTVGASGKERRVMNVAAGELSATSTDAVNGSQLFALASRPVVRNTYVVDNTTVSSGDGNIVVSRLGDNYSVRLASSLQVDSVATGDVVLNQEGLSVDGDTYVSQEGLDANYKRVQHVYPARVEQGSWDAVNGHQLYQMQSRLDEVDMRGRSGVASAMATAMLPQEYLAGARAISAGVAHFRGESALAVGGSMVSDNGRWIVKGAVNMNRNDAGFGVGVSYRWK